MKSTTGTQPRAWLLLAFLALAVVCGVLGRERRMQATDGVELLAPALGLQDSRDANLSRPPMGARTSDARTVMASGAMTGEESPHGIATEGELSSPRTLPFQVLGPNGEPIPGAIACDGAQAKRCSAPTDDAGRGVFRLREQGLAWLYIAALGYEVTQVDITPDDLQASASGDVKIIHLERETVLTVHVRAPDPESLTLMSLAIHSDTQLLAHEGIVASPLQRVCGANKTTSGGMGDGGYFVRYLLPPSGRIVIAGIRAETALELSVMDWHNATFHAEPLRPLYPGEARVHEVMIAGRPRDFCVRVLSESGEAIQGATVWLVFREDRKQGTRTHKDGWACFEAVWAANTGLQVTHAGHVPMDLPHAELPDGGQIEVRMQQGFQVRVRVEDDAGRFAPASVLALVDGLGDLRADEPGGRSHVFHDLPGTGVRFKARVGGRLYVVEHDATVPEVTILVPAHGALEVLLAGEPEAGDTISLLPADSDTWPTRVLSSGLSQTFDWLYPGEYTLCIQARGSATEGEWADRSARIPLTVVAGETQSVSLGR